jgi:lipoprotein NlpD
VAICSIGSGPRDDGHYSDRLLAHRSERVASIPFLISITSRSLAVLLLSLGLLAGCASNSDRTERSDTYTVKRGDTLSAIASRHKLDYKDLARWNRIGRDYVIHPGQKLRLHPPARNATSSPPRASAPKTVGPKNARIASAPPKARPTPKPPKPKPKPKPASPPRQAVIPAGPPPKWQWPVSDGKATLTSRPNGGNGLTIVGTLGEDIRSAGGGRVVYTGSGLLGYGQLIIIKHNETYLSAYGHLQSVLIKEGDTVSAGQRIATMGNGPQGSPLLYFEIRVNGTPRNPLALLPQR